MSERLDLPTLAVLLTTLLTALTALLATLVRVLLAALTTLVLAALLVLISVVLVVRHYCRHGVTRANVTIFTFVLRPVRNSTTANTLGTNRAVRTRIGAKLASVGP